MESQTDETEILPTEAGNNNNYFGASDITGFLTADTVKSLEISFGMLSIITNTKVTFFIISYF